MPIANYEQLVSAVATKKSVAQASMVQAQKSLGAINCQDGQARERYQAFNGEMIKVKNALQEYRTAVKNLIVAVRSANGQFNSPKPSSSPKPTASPRPTKAPKVKMTPQPTQGTTPQI